MNLPNNKEQTTKRIVRNLFLLFLFLLFTACTLSVARVVRAQTCEPPCNRPGYWCSCVRTGCQCCRCVYGNAPGERGPITCCSPPGRSGCRTSDRLGCKECSCTGWRNRTCGGGSCAADERRQTRDCDPDGCKSESRCVNDPSCVPPPPPPPPPPEPIPPAPPKPPIPSPYVPCNEVRSPEFHSLRPYQKSPCDQEVHETALYCGNDLILGDSITVVKLFNPPDLNGPYLYEGSPTDPVGDPCEFTDQCPQDSFCVDHFCRPGICIDNDDGTETCKFVFDRQRQIAVDLEGAYLPIMGNTELVVNSYEQPNPEGLNDAAKINEYVSWYLNGVIGRAEYPPPDPDDEEGRKKIIDFSGPLKKLLSQSSQDKIRFDEIDDAVDSRSNDAGIRHDQVVGCVNALNQRTECYPQRPLVTEKRMSDLELPLTRLLTKLFSYVPFSSTEDRIGLAEISGANLQPLQKDVFVTNVVLENQVPAELYFSHMQESSELAKILQRTFVPKGNLIKKLKPTKVASVFSPFCDLKQIRSNPGDDLFAGEITADLNYTAVMKCEFLIPGNGITSPWGNLCENLLRGECRNVDPSWHCPGPDYGDVDCQSGLDCIVNGNQCKPPPDGICNTLGLVGAYCVPNDWPCFVISPEPMPCSSPAECPQDIDCVGNFCDLEEYCPDGFKCASGSCKRPVTPTVMSQPCPADFNIVLNTITKTPLANEIWARLVAGPASVFKRLFPRIKEGAPIEALLDIPAATGVRYSSLDGTPVLAGNPRTGRVGDEAELYFPHIGGIHEYFLRCIQKTLRPKGFADEAACMSGEPVVISSCGEAFAKYNPPSGTTPMANDYFNYHIATNLTEELINVYAQAEAQTGVPCEILAGIHFIEANNSPDQSLISGTQVGSPEPTAGGRIFNSLLETAIYAANHLKGKVGGNIPDMQEMIKALSRYNGGGNRNCGWPVTYAGCPPQFEGEDDPYGVNWLDSRHQNMFLIYCADYTPCSTPQPFTRPGALTVAVEFYLSQE